jgi:hypothetical protein
MITTNTIKPEFNFNESLRLLDEVHESNLDVKSEEIINFITKNKGRGESEEVQDNLYKDAQVLWKNFSSELESIKYNFLLNRPQSKYLKDLLSNKLEYDTNTVFFAIELSKMLENMTNLTNDVDYQSIELSATEITYVYHLISKHKVKGLTKDTYNFVDILMLIGKTSKIFDYYNTLLENLSTDIKEWVTLFDENVTSDKVSSIDLEPQES